MSRRNFTELAGELVARFRVSKDLSIDRVLCIPDEIEPCETLDRLLEREGLAIVAHGADGATLYRVDREPTCFRCGAELDPWTVRVLCSDCTDRLDEPKT